LIVGRCLQKKGSGFEPHSPSNFRFVLNRDVVVVGVLCFVVGSKVMPRCGTGIALSEKKSE
jgi:hypothetical protein